MPDQEFPLGVARGGFHIFRTHGRFATSVNAAAVSGATRVFASICEVDGNDNPILGNADTRLYNVVPTFNRLTFRGEVLFGADLNIRITWIIF